VLAALIRKVQVALFMDGKLDSDAFQPLPAVMQFMRVGAPGIGHSGRPRPVAAEGSISLVLS
jgi:hypothetical protein